MGVFRLKRKTYSLEEGKFTGERFSAKKTYLRQSGLGAGLGAAIGGAVGKGKGAAIGGAVGGVLGLITAALTRSIFNRDIQNNITTKNLFQEFSNSVEEAKRVNKKLQVQLNVENYDLGNNNPNLFDLNVKSNEDSIVMYIRPLSRSEIEDVNRILDYWCVNSKNNDYVAEKTKEGGWIVTMKLVNYKSAANLLFELMSELEFRINFITR